ncbi:MAG: ATP-binding protein [Asticcacaulis sp.]
MIDHPDEAALEANRLEARRLDALRAAEILDSDPEPGFDSVTRLAADLFATPMAAVSLIDTERQWFKACVGLEVCETSRDVAFCDHAIRRDAVMVVPDATLDPRFCDNPLVTGEANIRFYAGAPVRFNDIIVGSLCVIDTKPRHDFDEVAAGRLTALAATVSSMMAMRRDGLIKKEAIRQAEATQKKLEMMEAAAGVGYWHIDAAAGTVQWSRGIYAIHGLSPETHTPQLGDALERYHPDDRERVREHVDRAVAEGKPFAFEARLDRPEGEGRTVFAQGTVEHDDQGQPLSIFGVFQDITEQKLIEQTLTEARRSAEAFAQAQADFLSNMSHEIRTPLTTIIGYTNLLSETDDLSPETQTFVSRLQKAGRALLSLVNDILDFSKLEAGLVTLDPQDVDVRELAYEVCEQFAVQTRARGVKLSLDYATSCPDWLRVDDVRLTQVLYNLVGNACKFTSEGEVRLKIAATGEVDAPRLRIEVHDTGPGIPEAHRTRLFRRFSQADHSINREHGGSGLGLSICYEISQLMTGDIGVVSEEGRGSCFWFEAPVALAAPRSEAASVVPYAELPTALPWGLRVLLVEDHTANRQMIGAILTSAGVSVTEAANGAEAVAHCMAQVFDLVLMDVRMPVLDGASATRVIREQCRLNACTPIIALSAMADSLSPADAALFDQRVAKPVAPDTLLRAVSTARGSSALAPVSSLRRA